MMRWVWIALVAAACTKPSVDSDPPDLDTGPPPLDLSYGDALVWQARSPTSTFWETTDVAVVGDTAYTCTGVESLVTHDVSDPAAIHTTGKLMFDGSNNRYPRCTHIGVEGERMVVSARLDEVQPRAWVALLDVSDPANPVIETQWVAEPQQLLEEPVLWGDGVAVADATDGVMLFDADLNPQGTLSGMGPVTRLATQGDALLAGTSDGWVHTVASDGTLQRSVDVGGAVQALLDLGDGRFVAAVGSAGLAVVDATGVAQTVDTHGIATRLDRMPSGELLVANWSDVRLYRVWDGGLVLRAVDAIFQADERPRTLAAGAGDGLVVAGEWAGVHALTYAAELGGPEVSPSSLALSVPGDGDAQQTELRILNEGSMDLEIDGIQLPAGWTGDAGALTLPPGESTTLSLAFEGTLGVASGDLVITSNDPDEAESRVKLRAGSSKVFVGDPAPDFTYDDVRTGQSYSLSMQRGNVVLLSYFATF